MSMEQQAKSPPDLKKVAQFLRSGSAGIKVRVGALNGKRIDYFKGKQANLKEQKSKQLLIFVFQESLR